MAQDGGGLAGDKPSSRIGTGENQSLTGWRCYLCGESEAERVTRNVDFGLDVFTCLSCGLTQTDYVSEEDLETYYLGAYSAAHGRTSSDNYVEFSRQRGIAQRRCIERLSGKASFDCVLDFGAGAGGGVRAFAPDAKKVLAWDPDPEMRSILTEAGASEITSDDDLFAGAYDGVFDLIILSHVMEHFPDPRHMLGRLHRLLKDGGLLFVEVPCETPRMVRDIALHLKTGTSHLFHFNRVTLQRVAEADGLFRSCGKVVQCGPSAATVFEPDADFNPENEDNSDGVWLRGVFAKELGGAAPGRRPPDPQISQRRFSALNNLAMDAASLRGALRKVYGGFLNMVEFPSKYPGAREAVGDEGPASSSLSALIEDGLAAFKNKQIALDKAQGKLERAVKATEEKHKTALQQALREQKQAHQQTLSAQEQLASSKIEAAKRRITQLEERSRLLARERDLYRGSTSYRLGRLLLSPVRVARSVFSRNGNRDVPSSLDIKANEKASTSPVDVLVVCHDTSMSTGSPRPALGYFEEMKNRGESVRLLALPKWDASMNAAKPLPPAKKIIINSIASLRWRAVRDLLEAHPGNVWIYLHETAWAMEKFQDLCPEGFETLKSVAAKTPMLSVSDGQKRFFESEYGAQHITVIRNTTQNANLDPANVQAEGKDDTSPAIIMVGTIQARKGPELFSKVADLAQERGKPWRFQWIGHETGDDELYLSKNVDWAGVLKGDALANAYKNASLFFLPSMDDPFPLASLEAMSYGVNVVCYTEVGAAEIIDDLPGSTAYARYTPEEAFASIERALSANSDAMQVFETVKPFVDPVHFANVVNRAIGHETPNS